MGDRRFFELRCHVHHDGLCTSDDIDITGCTDATACNYNPNATADDGSCEFDIAVVALIFSMQLRCCGDHRRWLLRIDCAGCTDASACNYDPAATIDDGSCCNWMLAAFVEEMTARAAVAQTRC